MVIDFLGIEQQRMNKQLMQWRKQNLHLSLAGNLFPDAYIASWLLVQETTVNLPQIYHLKTHGTKIDVQKCGEFLVKDTSREDITKMEFFNIYKREI